MHIGRFKDSLKIYNILDLWVRRITRMIWLIRHCSDGVVALLGARTSLSPSESRAVPLLSLFPLPDMMTRLKTSAFQCRFALEDIRKGRGSHMTIQQKPIMWSKDRLLFQGSSSWYEGLHYSDNSFPIIFHLAVVTSIGAGVHNESLYTCISFFKIYHLFWM